MNDKDRKHVEEAKTRWPNINAIIHPENCLKYLAQWARNHDSLKHSPEDMKEALRLYMLKEMDKVPEAEAKDALAETMSATILDELRKASVRLHLPTKEGGDHAQN